MKILITNDDSVNASELIPLIQWCRQQGDVTVVVPKYEQSAKSHSIEIRSPFEARQIELQPGLTVWTVDSTPADCVRFAVSCLKESFDLVISGINRGYNLGSDCLYSGTLAAATEAVNKGISAIAISSSLKCYSQAVCHLDEIFSCIRENRLLSIHSLYNINIPPEPKGILITRQGGPSFAEKFVCVGENMYQPTGGFIRYDGSETDVDVHAVAAGYISITPMTLNRTEINVFRQLQNPNT